MGENKIEIPNSLPAETIKLLAPYFPGLDLFTVKIFFNIPAAFRAVSRVDPLALTLGRRIYFSYAGVGCYDPHSLEGLELIAHELTHVRQFAENRSLRFAYRYLIEYKRNLSIGLSSHEAYLNIKYEQEAVENASRIVRELSEMLLKTK